MSVIGEDRPAHVPPGLVVDFDTFTDPAFQGDPHAGLHALQARKPMFYTPRGGGHWVVTDGAAVAEIFTDTERFTAYNELAEQGGIQIPMAIDPPDHAKYRRLIDPLLSPKVVNARAQDIRAFARELIEKVADRGECEFVSQIAEPFPVTIFLKLADFPVAELPKFRSWAKTFFHDPDMGRQFEALTAIGDYLDSVIPQRRAHPGEDLLSGLALSSVDGRPLSPVELRSMMFAIFGGGLDTVLNTLSFVIMFLANHPEHRKRLVDEPSLIPAALEELMRRHSIASLFRTAKHDMVFRGVALKAGDRLWCSTIMMAMDETLAPDALTVDFGRTVGRNPIFGVGPHHCPGRYLARLELRIFLEEWLARIPEFEVAAGPPLRILTGPSMGLASLPLSWAVLEGQGPASMA